LILNTYDNFDLYSNKEKIRKFKYIFKKYIESRDISDEKKELIFLRDWIYLWKKYWNLYVVTKEKFYTTKCWTLIDLFHSDNYIKIVDAYWNCIYYIKSDSIENIAKYLIKFDNILWVFKNKKEKFISNDNVR